jgi:hypothetical protein
MTEPDWFDVALGPRALKIGVSGNTCVAELIRGAYLPSAARARQLTLSVVESNHIPQLPPLDWARAWIAGDHQIPEDITFPYRIMFDRQVGVVYALDIEAEHGVIWIRRPSEVDMRSFITPFRIMLSWLAGLFGGEVIHGSAAVVGGAGILLSGPSGSGKSTTAIALALGGHVMVSDDCVLVHQGHVYAVYSRAKVDRLRGLPGVTDKVRIQRLVGTAIGKDFFALEDLGESFARSARLHGLAFPKMSRSPGFFRISRERARLLLTEDSLRETKGGTQENVLRLAHLAIRYPAFRLLLAENPAEREVLLERLAAAVLADEDAPEVKSRG